MREREREGAQSMTFSRFVVQLCDNSCMRPWVSSRAVVISEDYMVTCMDIHPALLLF